MSDVIRILGERLEAARSASTFEEVTERLLHILTEVWKEHVSLERSGLSWLRGSAFLRPSGQAKALHAVELTNNGEPSDPPSLTAWRWVAEQRGAVIVDTQAQNVHVLQERAFLQGSAQHAEDFRSRETLLKRRAELIVAFPLRAPGRPLEGMLSIEIAGALPGGVGALSEFSEEAQIWIDVFAPFLLVAPPRRIEDVKPDRYLPVIGPEMQQIVRRLKAFVELEEPLLLRGETGVGKSQMAKRVHAHSARSTKPFKTVNLQAIPEGLRETYLFGVRRGAYTGATADRTGMVAAAEGGTLFIDEIDKLPLSAQAALLSFLEDGSYSIIGDTTDQRADVRIIIGTNANLENAVETGSFLRDLYYRINVLPIQIPPLSERRGDIGPWADVMVAGVHRKSSGEGTAILGEGARRLLEQQPWPGNLRELNSLVKRAYAFAKAETTETSAACVSIHQRYVEEALRLERTSGPALLKSLRDAAQSFVDEAKQRVSASGASVLTWDDGDVFKSLVLETAARELGDKEAFVLLGKATSLRSSNHLKILRREEEKVRQLLSLLEE